MPSKINHLKTAEENKAISLMLLQSNPRSLAWATTISFYAALHLVEAALSADGIHCEGHNVRNKILKTDNKYSHIWKHYKPLYDHSLRARYLMDGNSGAEELMEAYLGEEKIRSKIIGHYLHQVEKSVRKFIGSTSTGAA